jgi:hypothetical protein
MKPKPNPWKIDFTLDAQTEAARKKTIARRRWWAIKKLREENTRFRMALLNISHDRRIVPWVREIADTALKEKAPDEGA